MNNKYLCGHKPDTVEKILYLTQVALIVELKIFSTRDGTSRSSTQKTDSSLIDL